MKQANITQAEKYAIQSCNSDQLYFLPLLLFGVPAVLRFTAWGMVW